YHSIYGGPDMSYETLYKFLPAIRSLHPSRTFAKEDLLTETFLLEKEDKIKMNYASHNEYVNQKVKIVIVGITPGWQQMKTAFMAFVDSQEVNESLENSFY